MSETLARITTDNRVELIKGGMSKIDGADPMTPTEAAFFARGVLACAVALSGPNPPPAGSIGGDAHMPIMSWVVGCSNDTGLPAMIVTVPSGIALTFVMPPKGAIELGQALVAQGNGLAPPEGQRGTVH